LQYFKKVYDMIEATIRQNSVSITNLMPAFSVVSATTTDAWHREEGQRCACKVWSHGSQPAGPNTNLKVARKRRQNEQPAKCGEERLVL
jgi:hypothetical protein